MINFALCGNNVLLLSNLQNLLDSIFLKHDLSANIIFKCTDSNDLLDFLNNTDNASVDVLFLDIDLHSDKNGIEIAKQIRKKNKSIYIIFITRHFEYILSAIECKIFDFIQKPFSRSKLENTIIRLFDDINFDSQHFIKLNNNNKFLNQNLINFIQKDGMKTIYNIKSGTESAYGSFNSISQSLPNNFVRCHRSFIVNINNIKSVDFKSNMILFTDTYSPDSICFIGPKYKNSFMEALNNYGSI